jgi:proliferating cell nuclear antigen PCNA
MEIELPSQKSGLFKDIVELVGHVCGEVDITVTKTAMAIQCMDLAHAVLLDITLPVGWFTRFVLSNDVPSHFGVRIKDFVAVLGCRSKQQSIIISASPDDVDKITVAFSCGDKGDFDKEFELPLYEFDRDVLEIPEREHDVDMTMQATRLFKLVSELESFGPATRVDCDDTHIMFSSREGPISMHAHIDVAELEDYALPEEGVTETFAATYLVMAAAFAKLSKYAYVSKTVTVHFTAMQPAEFIFVLGEGVDAPRVRAIVAPKIANDDE